MIEISVDQSDRVFVRWHGGGAWTVLDRDGSVTEEATALAAAPWRAVPEPDEFDDFLFGAEFAEAEGPVADLSAPRPIRTVNLPGGGP